MGKFQGAIYSEIHLHATSLLIESVVRYRKLLKVSLLVVYRMNYRSEEIYFWDQLPDPIISVTIC